MLKFLFSFCLVTLILSKFSFSQEVISTGGDYFIYQNGPSVSLTIGEGVAETYILNEGILTNGFQQPPGKNNPLDITVFLQGLYASASMMNPAMDEVEPRWGPTIADHITVELHDASDYSKKIASVGDIVLNTDGTALLSLPYHINGNYYITIKHWNSIETVSAHPISFAGGTTSYDFSDSVSKAFGYNMLGVDGVYMIYGADVNQDGIVDSGDMNAVENKSIVVTMGYVAEDVNGDGIVDSGDINLVENNSVFVVLSILP